MAGGAVPLGASSRAAVVHEARLHASRGDRETGAPLRLVPYGAIGFAISNRMKHLTVIVKTFSTTFGAIDAAGALGTGTTTVTVSVGANDVFTPADGIYQGSVSHEIDVCKATTSCLDAAGVPVADPDNGAVKGLRTGDITASAMVKNLRPVVVQIRAAALNARIRFIGFPSVFGSGTVTLPLRRPGHTQARKAATYRVSSTGSMTPRRRPSTRSEMRSTLRSRNWTSSMFGPNQRRIMCALR